MSPHQILEVWGARSHQRLTDPLTPRKGGVVGVDDDEAAMHYVETTGGFDVARPVLRHVHILGREIYPLPRCVNPLGAFVLRNPGETLPQALRRLGWWQCALLRESDIPISVYEGFVGLLALRLRETPFVPPTHFCAESDEGPATPAEKQMFSMLVQFQTGHLGEVGYSDLLFIRNALLSGESSTSIMDRLEARRRNRKRSLSAVKLGAAQVQRPAKKPVIVVGRASKRQ